MKLEQLKKDVNGIREDIFYLKRHKDWYNVFIKLFNHPQFNNQKERNDLLELVFLQLGKMSITMRNNGIYFDVKRKNIVIFKRSKLSPQERKRVIDINLNISYQEYGITDILKACINNKHFTVDENVYIINCLIKHDSFYAINFSFNNYFGQNFEKNMQEYEAILLNVNDAKVATEILFNAQKSMGRKYKFSIFEYQKYNRGDESCNPLLKNYFNMLKNVYEHHKKNIPNKTMLQKTKNFHLFGSIMSEAEQNKLLQEICEFKRGVNKIIETVKRYVENSYYKKYGYTSLYQSTQDLYDSYKVFSQLSK